MEFIRYTRWIVFIYPILGLIILTISYKYSNEIILAKIEKLTGIINITFAIWLSFVLIGIFVEEKKESGKYFSNYNKISEWFFTLSIFTVLILICFNKIRKKNFSILLFSLIIFFGVCLSMLFFKLEPGA